MSMTPEEKQEILEKQKADAKLRNEEAQKIKNKETLKRSKSRGKQRAKRTKRC